MDATRPLRNGSEGNPMIATDKDSIGKAIGRIASGLYIITIRLGERPSAFLGSWVQQASFEPPILSVAIKAGRQTQELFEDGAHFAVNIIPNGDTALMKHFGRGFGPDQDPYEGMAVIRGVTGVELLPQAVADLECKIVASQAVGDHVIYFGEVIAGRLNPDVKDPAVHIRKSGFHY
ncbi:MAG: flavin reductase family protein [Candidatus Sericytochromatia bacterium]|nr:flavin reductase family protein [Candidatus Sericytochromatia bacterium]